MSLFGSLTSVLTGGASKFVKGISGALGGTDPITGINPIQDYTGITAANMQKDIAEKNLKLQQEQFNYQQWLNKEQMRREDESYQRKVKDMTKAGFNPILAAGGAGEPSAPLKSAPAPQMDSSFTDKYAGAGQALVSGILSLLTMKKDFAMKDASIKLMGKQEDEIDANIDFKNAEANKLNAEADRILMENKYGDEYFRLRNESMALKNYSQSISNYLDSSTVETKIASARVNLDMDNVKLYNSQLDSELLRLGISRSQIENEILAIDKKYKGSVYEAELLSKSLLALKTGAEYSSLMFDIDFYNRQHNLPVGYNIPVLARYSDYISGLETSAWRDLKEFLNGRINFSEFYDSVFSFSSSVSKAMDDIAEEIGVAKNEFVWSFRRPADGVRRNKYSVMFDFRR